MMIMAVRTGMNETNRKLRERWCDIRTRRATDLTDQDVIMLNGQWTEVLGVYRDMDEWEAEFGALGGDTAGPERELAEDALDWSTPTWVLLRVFDLASSDPATTGDRLVKVYKFSLIPVQTLPAWYTDGSAAETG
jgi:hypothetical protein